MLKSSISPYVVGRLLQVHALLQQDLRNLDQVLLGNPKLGPCPEVSVLKSSISPLMDALHGACKRQASSKRPRVVPWKSNTSLAVAAAAACDPASAVAVVSGAVAVAAVPALAAEAAVEAEEVDPDEAACQKPASFTRAQHGAKAGL